MSADPREWKDLVVEGEVIGLSRQLSDQLCILVKLEVLEVPFYFAERLQEDNVMRFGIRGFDDF
jgi:hypothetical protein